MLADNALLSANGFKDMQEEDKVAKVEWEGRVGKSSLWLCVGKKGALNISTQAHPIETPTSTAEITPQAGFAPQNPLKSQ